MRETEGLDYQVEQESAGVRIIPEDLFELRDAIPFYGLGSSGWRCLKECGDCITATREESIGTRIRKDLRIFSRVFEFYAICIYNIGIATIAETLYTMIKH